MIIINYIKPNIVVYADYLFSGVIEINDLRGNVILRKKVNQSSLENIYFKLDEKVKVKVKTKNKVISKILNN
jgi:hypothetical protein